MEQIVHGIYLVISWSLDPTVRHTVWGLSIANGLREVGLYGLSQASVQRYSSTKSMREARKTVLFNFPALCLLTLFVCLNGLSVFAYFSATGCDPLANRDVNTPNQLLPLFVTRIFSNTPGFAGLFLATLYGGALSTLSSSLSGAAANCWDDILRLKLSQMSEERKALTNRLLVMIFGFLAAGIAFVAATVPGPVTQITGILISVSASPYYSLFIMGALFKRVHWKGAIIGSMGALLVVGWLVISASQLPIKQPTLPPTSVDRCPVASTELSWQRPDVTADWTTAATPVTSPLRASDAETQKSSVLGDALLTFSLISYVWYWPFGVTFATVVGFLVSSVFRDKTAEEGVDEKLLISFRRCFHWKTDTVAGVI